MNVNDATILNFLDLPPRILLWPVSQVMSILVPSFFLMAFGYVMMAFLLGVMIMTVINIFKRHFGQGYLHGVLYWYLPTSMDQFPVTPPSYMRTFIN